MGLLIVLAMVLMIAAVLIAHRFRTPQRRPSGQRARASSSMYRGSIADGASETGEVPIATRAARAARAAEQDGNRAEPSTNTRFRVREVHLDDQLPTIDLRSLPAARFRIVGTAYWLRNSERARYGGQRYVLVREPENEHDANAVAVFGKGRKVGHLSAAKAAAVASELDRLGAAGFVVSGASVSPQSSRLWVDIPRLPALRSFRPSSSASPLDGRPEADGPMLP